MSAPPPAPHPETDGHYRAIVDSAIDFAIIATDTSGVVTHWSHGASDIFGHAADAMVGRPLLAIFTPDDLASHRPTLDRQRAAITGRSSGERYYQRRDSSTFWGQSETTPLKDDAGVCVGFVKIIRDGTARRVAAEQLHEARVLSESILRSTRDWIVVLDLAGRTLELAAGAIESMEVTDVPAILGQSWLDVWSGSDKASALRAVETARSGGLGRFEGYCATHAGRPKWWDVVISPLNDAQGRPERLVSVGRDISDSVLARREFQTIAESLPNHVWTASADGQLDWFNEQVYRYTGLARGSGHGADWTSIVHPEDIAHAAERWADALARGVPYEAEFRLRRADGTYRWHIGRAMPVRTEAGAVIRWVGTNTDIAGERAAHERLAARATTLEEEVEVRTQERDRAWENSQDLQAIWGADGHFISVNRSWTTLLGWSADELVGQHYLQFVHEDDRPESVSNFARAPVGAMARRENRYRRKSGGFRTFSWVATRDATGLTFGSGRDITDERRAASALASAQDQLRQSQKMEAVGQLTGGVAHDFNNILQVISSNLQLLARQTLGDEAMEQRIGRAQDAVRRGAKLASQLLSFSRRQPLAPKAVNAGRLLAGMEDMLKRALGAAIELEFIVSGGLWNTFADPTQIENAVLNLAINARDAMQGHGKLTIEVNNASLDAPYARKHTEVTPGQYVLIAVSDTGVGMTPDVIARAFEPFFTTKEAGTGSGLGLAMVHGFARQSGGHAKIYSEAGHGTTVKLYLPRSTEREEPIEPSASVDASGGNETILVAEDDDGVRAATVELLAELGYTVLQARDAASALTVIESGAHVDLLFTDVVMPGPLKSSELARRAVALQPGLAVLFTSGYTQNAIVHGGRLDPGVELIGKPYARDELARRIRQVLAKKAARGPA